MNRIG